MGTPRNSMVVGGEAEVLLLYFGCCRCGCGAEKDDAANDVEGCVPVALLHRRRLSLMPPVLFRTGFMV